MLSSAVWAMFGLYYSGYFAAIASHFMILAKRKYILGDCDYIAHFNLSVVALQQLSLFGPLSRSKFGLFFTHLAVNSISVLLMLTHHITDSGNDRGARTATLCNS